MCRSVYGEINLNDKYPLFKRLNNLQDNAYSPVTRTVSDLEEVNGDSYFSRVVTLFCIR